MSNVGFLLQTKFSFPAVRAKVIRRPRLVALLHEGLKHPLTLISAPAGFGKTTLLGEWHHSDLGRGLASAWLTLDSEDSELTRFLTYLTAAIGNIEPVIGASALRLLQSPQSLSSSSILTMLINELATLDHPAALVLDDYHVIESEAVHQAVMFFLDHLPEQMHVVIATRSDPPLPLARLRARAELVEIRADDLRFTPDEAAEFLQRVLSLPLATEHVAALAARTEGWIAGLQMAALSMRNRDDIQEFIEGFSGTNRYIMDYLLEEVLASQPPDVRQFLLYTSILERLTAPLCDAVLAGDPRPTREPDGEAAHLESAYWGQSAATLRYLDAANLFLVPLDEERVWYRYHHLFADLLRMQLHSLRGTQGVTQLHIRAADWHSQHGSIIEAIHHASAAGDDERVERFIIQSYGELVSCGEQTWLRFWTSKLNKELVYRRPWLCIYEAYSHSWFGELDQADRALDAAEKLIQSREPSPDRQLMRAQLDYAKSRVTAMHGDLDQAIELCLSARDYTPADNTALQLDTHITLGYEYFLNGDYARAVPVLRETIRSGIEIGAVINTVAASCLLARLYAVQGLLTKSYDTYETAARYIPEASGQHLGVRGLVQIGIADVLFEWNRLDSALSHLQQGLSMLPMWDKADDWALAHLTLAHIHLAQGNTSEALKATEAAAQFVRTRGTFCEARRAVEIARVKGWLAQEELHKACRWTMSQTECLGPSDELSFHNELAHIARARVWIALDKPHEAIGLLSRLEVMACSAGRMSRVVEILLLQALALQKMDDVDHALQVLTECLALAEPEGYARTFLDEGEPLRMLLARWTAHPGTGPLRDYATQLLSQFDAGLPPGSVDPKETCAVNLVEPLTERELEVLHLISLGKTNKDVAEELFVAPGTVKAHTSSIYRKLDVANRTEAVARARQLDILA